MNVRDLLQSGSPDVIRDSQVCVVGGGIAGLTIATVLAKAGKRIALIERGPEKVEPHGADESDDTELARGQQRGLGGTSLVWGGRLLPLTEHDIGPRPYLSLDGWPLSIAELERYRLDAERLFEVDHTSFEADCLDRSALANLLPRKDADFICRLPKWPTFRNRNMVFLLRKQLARLRNLEIWTNAAAFDFELDEELGRVTGIRARAPDNSRMLTVRAKDFVLAAGTIETTRLLLLLDRASGERAFARCKVLGRYFQEHLKAEVGVLNPVNRKRTSQLFSYHVSRGTRRSVYLELTPDAQRTNRIASAYLTVRLDFPLHSPLGRISKSALGQPRGDVRQFRRAIAVAANPDFVIRSIYWRSLYKMLFLPPSTRFLLDVRIEQIPHWSNHISLSQKQDANGVPIAEIDWRPTAMEERTFRVAIERTAEYWRRSGLDHICPIEWTNGARDRSTAIIDEARTTWHPSGSTRMGSDHALSVVGSDLRCHCVPNVVVISASVFPSAGSVNPTFTLLQLAFRAAEHMIAKGRH